MKYEIWVRFVPVEIREDSVWNLKVYRASLYLSDLCWEDTSYILDKKFFSLADQIYRSTASVSANITEGYSRSSHKEKARFYEIALGSARENKDWYCKSRHILGREKSQNRILILSSIVKLLLTMINEKRKSYKASEPNTAYVVDELENLLKISDGSD